MATSADALPLRCLTCATPWADLGESEGMDDRSTAAPPLTGPRSNRPVSAGISASSEPTILLGRSGFSTVNEAPP